jgi:DNA primase
VSLSTAFLDELRERTTLSTLIGKTVKLQKAGVEWKACCPFHKEKTASFYVNDEKGFAHCFGCSFHCDAIGWLVESRGLEFLDAVRELADAAGMEMPSSDPDQRDRTAGMHAVMARAEAWFREQLMGLAGAAARDYLATRGVGMGEIDAFGIGYAPESRTRLRQALADMGDDALVDAGLVVMPDEGEPYDRFRNRVIFPIRDQRGRPIGFGGRILGNGEPKYLNSPATPLFDKGRTLFNVDRAAPAARQSGRIVAVEGYMDVIGLARVGIDDAVAPNGTAVTEAQLGLLWRYAPMPIMCFDGDKAGQRAMIKTALRALPFLEPGRSLAFAAIPAGRDPDDIAREGGAAAIEALLEKAEPLVDLIWRHESAAQPLTTPEARAALRQRLIEHSRAIAHADVGREYEREFRVRIDALFSPAPRQYGGKRGSRRADKPKPYAVDLENVRRKTITAVLRGCARHFDAVMDDAEKIAALPVLTDTQREVRDRLLDAAFAGTAPDVIEIDECFPDDRGWKGLGYSFVRTKAKPAQARADLAIMLDRLLSEAR